MKEIFARRSVRTYLDKSVEKEKLEQLLRAAMQAPSAGNQQPWEFVVITDKDMLYKLVDVSQYASPVGRASAAIVMLANVENLRFPTFWVQDLSNATENILLEAVDLDLGAVWLGVHGNPEAEENLARILDLPDHVKPFAIIALGYPDKETEERPIRHDPSKVHYESY